MRIINFNRRDKIDNTGLLDTYIDWNKQYCYDLSRKITSLYDYMMWNYPEYFIFNAPNSLSGSDDFIPYKSLVDKNEEPRLVQPYEAHVAFNSDDDEPNLSLFFPSRLNYHQGFYNQSIYGDAILMCWHDDQWASLIKTPYYNLANHLFLNSGDDWNPEDLNTKNYDIYIYDVAEYTDEEYETPISLTAKDLYLRTKTVNIGLNCSDIKVIPSGKITITSQSYDTKTGDLTVNWSNLTPSAPSKASLTISYTQKVGSGDFKWQKKTNTSDLFQQTTGGRLIYDGYKKCLLIHKTHRTQYGQIELIYDEGAIKLITTTDQAIHTVTEDTDGAYNVVTYEPGTYNDLVQEEDVDIAPYINFPSGYICILNKQPTGANNEQNPIKNNLSNYLIAPIGNGGYYDIWWNNSVLQANYKANELNNFSSKLTINLAQNCRYINPSNDTFSFTGEKLNVTIPNWYIDNDKVKPQLSDKYKNIWTGQEDLIAQLHFGGEKIFADVQYDSFGSVVKQQNVHNFNAHVDEPFSLTRVNLLIY